jgi:uncharacterized membrane protein
MEYNRRDSDIFKMNIKEFIVSVFCNKFTIMFTILGLGYLLIEVIFRAVIYNISTLTDIFPYFSLIGFTSLWMFFIGATSGICLGLMNDNKFINEHLNIFWQSIIGAVIVLIIEYISGLIFNIGLNLYLWDYKKLPLNINGQVCLFFGVFWFLITPFGFFMYDFIHSYLYKDKIRYGLIEIYRQLFKIKAKPFI